MKGGGSHPPSSPPLVCTLLTQKEEPLKARWCRASKGCGPDCNSCGNQDHYHTAVVAVVLTVESVARGDNEGCRGIKCIRGR